MNSVLSDADMAVALYLNPEPVEGVRETDHEWSLGAISLSKHYAGFRVGYGQHLEPGAMFFKQWFELEGARGWAIVFRSMGAPPLYFAGWVSPEKEFTADQWINLLNQEIEKRHAGIDSRSSPTVGPPADDPE